MKSGEIFEQLKRKVERLMRRKINTINTPGQLTEKDKIMAIMGGRYAGTYNKSRI